MIPTPIAGRTGRAVRLPAPVRREQILEAAITVFAQASYRDASTAAIASELGVSEPTLFRHFPSKRALYLAAIERSGEMLAGRWQEIAADAPTPLAALLEMGRWYFAELQSDSRALRLRFRSCSETADPEVATRVREQFRDVFELVRALYEAARANGEIASDTDTRAHAWLFMAVGTLLDTTQMLGLRDALPLDAMPGIMMVTAPRPGPAVAHAGEGA
jgi:AcrR family transcriptional regulator